MERELNPALVALSDRTLVEIKALQDLLGAHLPVPIRRQRQLAALMRLNTLCLQFEADHQPVERTCHEA